MTVSKPFNELFTNDMGYWNSRLTKESTCYVEDVCNERNWVTKKAAFQMKDQNFNGKHPCRELPLHRTAKRRPAQTTSTRVNPFGSSSTNLAPLSYLSSTPVSRYQSRLRSRTEPALRLTTLSWTMSLNDRDRRQNSNGRRRHPNIWKTTHNVDRIQPTNMDNEVLMQICPHREGDQGNFRWCSQQVGVWNTPLVKAVGPVPLNGRPGTKGGILYRRSRNVCRRPLGCWEPEALGSREQEESASSASSKLGSLNIRHYKGSLIETRVIQHQLTNTRHRPSRLATLSSRLRSRGNSLGRHYLNVLHDIFSVCLNDDQKKSCCQ